MDNDNLDMVNVKEGIKIRSKVNKETVEIVADKETFDLPSFTNRALKRYGASLVEDTDAYAKFEGTDIILMYKKV